MMSRVRDEWREFRVLVRDMPAVTMTLFVMAIFGMNLLANKSLEMPVEWLAADGGILLSWICFMTMDVTTKHFGPKAATELSVAALGLDLVFCGMFALVGALRGMWGEAYVEGCEEVICAALDHTFGGTWYVVLGSAAAFVASAVVNNFLNALIGRAFVRRPDGFAAYACRAYVSTGVGQLVDNLTFALLVGHRFFGWTLTQCISCSVMGMVLELLFEVVFSYAGYRTCVRWKRERVGEAYLKLRAQKGAGV